MEVFDLSEENELDTFMSREVLVPEGYEAQSLTQEELDQGKVSSIKTPKMFDSLIKLFEDKNINQKMALRKYLKNVKIQNAETMQSYFTKGLSNQRTT